MKRLMAIALCSLLALSTTALARDKPGFVPKGAQIGVVNLLDAELMHYHSAKDPRGSFLKIQPVTWRVDDMLNEALQGQGALQEVTLTPLAPTDKLLRARGSCFVDAPLVKGLPKSCSAGLAEFAASANVSYLIVMTAGLNNSDHTGSSRLEGPSEMLRGWGFVTRELAGAKDRPALFNEVELLLINVTSDGATLSLRQWGGIYTLQWQNYVVPSDPKAIPPEQLDQLQPLFATLLARQVKELVTQLHVQ